MVRLNIKIVIVEMYWTAITALQNWFVLFKQTNRVENVTNIYCQARETIIDIMPDIFGISLVNCRTSIKKTVLPRDENNNWIEFLWYMLLTI